MTLSTEKALCELQRYPACIYPAIEALPGADPDTRTRLIRRIALCIGDEAALRVTLGLDPAEFARFCPEKEPVPSTEDTITSFIGEYAPAAIAASPAPDKIVVAPAIDYASSFLNDTRHASRQQPLSEALAKMMVKNGNYQKAIEIITELHLKNPKKSVYFADRIRFLRKLIQIQEAKKGI